PYLKRLTAEVICGCPNNLEKARAIYDWITKNVVYSFVPDYIINENIPESMARNYTGDCGIYALLFITMCRIAGVPAQWQSGLDAEPFDVGAHDWARFYIAPYGWLYADGSFGAGSERSGNEESRKFYFGNLDPGRMVANNAFHQMFDIEKKHWRFDPYDNQTGEMEYEDRMIDHDEYVRRQVMTECEEVF
ncbi:MAG: transglutaminase domain-containing protein, partial [Firmicutes bacterium]|nr:transglutaminase domain-containing protein [Bacillota bacterium]